MNKRIILLNDYGTIRYQGPLLHKESPAGEVWCGIEWDDASRGRHSGKVEGHEYFKTKIEKAGSLVKLKNLDFGYDIINALQRKYFKNSKDWQLAIEKIENSQYVQDQLQAIENQEKELQQQGEKKEELNIQEIPEKKLQEIELDEEAYFDTLKKNKLQVEFYGFSEIWKKINDLQRLEHLSLCGQLVSSIEHEKVSILLPNLKELSLENNLIYSWKQIDNMVNNFQKLEILSLSGNQLCFDGYQAENSFPALQRIILVNMQLTFRDVNKILPLIKQTKELILTNNQCNDTENFEPKDYLKNLIFLNLENNKIQNYSPLDIQLKNLPNLEKLTLTRNLISELNITKDHYPKLDIISLEENNFRTFEFLDNLFPIPLTQIRNKLNYIDRQYTKDYVFQRTIAQLPFVKSVNGVLIKHYERKDSEIYYMREVYHEFFRLTKTDDKSFNEEELKKFSDKNHKQLDRLVKKYGKPYEPMLQCVKEKKEIEVNLLVKYLTLNIEATEGKEKGNVFTKRFPISVGVQALKKVVQTFTGVFIDEMVLRHDTELIDLKSSDTLIKMGIKEGSKIYVSTN